MNDKTLSSTGTVSKVSGLSSLFSKDKKAEPSLSVVAPAEGEAIQQLLLEKLQPGKYQPRTEFDEEALQELADSIRATGVIEPVVVRPIEGDCFEIIAGERRCRASKIAGKTTIPAIVRDMDDSTTAAVAMIENIQREDLSPMEEARGIQQLMDEFALNQKQVAEVISKKPDDVSKLLKLLSLPDCLHQLYEKGVTSPYTLDSLHRAYKENPEKTAGFAQQQTSLTKQQADAFLTALKTSVPGADDKNKTLTTLSKKNTSSSLRVEVVYQGVAAYLDLSKPPTQADTCWIHKGEESEEVFIEDLLLSAVV